MCGEWANRARAYYFYSFLRKLKVKLATISGINAVPILWGKILNFNEDSFTLHIVSLRISPKAIQA